MPAERLLTFDPPAMQRASAALQRWPYQVISLNREFVGFPFCQGGQHNERQQATAVGAVDDSGGATEARTRPCTRSVATGSCQIPRHRLHPRLNAFLGGRQGFDPLTQLARLGCFCSVRTAYGFPAREPVLGISLDWLLGTLFPKPLAVCDSTVRRQ